MDISRTKGRHFKGVVGLVPGYKDKDGGNKDRRFQREDLIDAWTDWAERQHQSKKTFLGALFSQEEILAYAFEKEGKLKFYTEPVIIVSGEIASYQEHMPDEVIFKTLQSLFEVLGQKTEQTTVRFTYFGDDSYRTSCRLRFEDKSHPLD